MSKSWDSGILKKLKALTGKGLSTAEIGKRLGISKNAVVGKLHRLGWNSKASESVSSKGVSKTKTSAKSIKVAKTGKSASKTSATKVVKQVKNTKKDLVSAKKSAKNVTVTKKTTKTVSVKTVKKTEKSPKVTAKTAKTVKVVTKEDKTEAPKKSASSTVSKKSLSLHQRMIQHSLEMMDLKPGQCRWPIGDPDSENFHFCGRQVFTGKPYCYEHCKQAYQFTAPKKK